jgi:streptomycin 6-kinase
VASAGNRRALVGSGGCSVIEVPADFAAGIVTLGGDAGRRWLDRLPSLVDDLCQRWHLVVDGAPMHGYLGLVVPVMRGDKQCVLKVSRLDESTAAEIAALTLWNGQGAVRLLAADPAIGALLLERLDSQRSLREVEIGRAVTIAGGLLHRLAVPALNNLPQLTTAAAGLAETLPKRWERLNRPMPRAFLDAARDAAIQIGPSAGSLLVNYDLHYGNVLAGEREPWLAIDPKVVVGDPEYGLAQLLWTRLEEIEQAGGLSYHFSALVDQAGLDLSRARSWTLVRCVDYWLWALSVGLTEDPVRCQAITTWLAL